MNKKIKKLLNKKYKSKVICLTAYSKNVASILDKHCDLVLVGDSLVSVLYNYKSTKEVTLDTMINHSKSVRLGIKNSFLIASLSSSNTVCIFNKLIGSPRCKAVDNPVKISCRP